ncbi:sulfatase [Leptotrichia sp. OH3620_COT-345]|nr:sulfatase [Leptotrichia sp. OH3620_COT-345]
MKKPNLLFLFADQWRRNSVGFMKKENVITPNMDMFSEEALVFENAVSGCPLCSPSRASILTGTYPITHGVWTNCKIGLEDVKLKEDAVTITDILKKNGYYTGYIGKWHLDSPEMNRDEAPLSGAKDWDAYTPPGKRRHGIDYWYSYGAYDNHMKPHYWSNSEKMIEIDKWSVEHETDKAIEFLEKCKEKDIPFSLFVSWNPPHTPLDLVPEKYVKMYENKNLKVNPNVKLENVTDHTESMKEKLNFTKEEYQDVMKKYYGAITGIDENFGRIINYLKERDLYENTIIILTADHGEMLCAHGLWSKHVWYEEAIGVPFLIKYGSTYLIGKTDTVISSPDIMPTVLSLMSIEIPDTVEGSNLKDSVMKVNRSSNGEESKAFISSYPGQISAIEKFERINEDNKKYGWRAVKTKTHTYVVNKGYNPGQVTERFLYDNINDEYQLNPLKLNESSENEISDRLEKMLKSWAEKHRDKFEF